MSKKKFTSGLDSLFGTLTEEAFQEDSPLLDKQKKEEKKQKAVAQKEKGKLKRSSSKNFTSDLETLFEQALNETIEEKLEKHKRKTNRKTITRRRMRPLSGLDALIRKTSEMDVVEVNIPNKKRVTFIFDKQKLLRLKEIAKKEKAYLKDIIGEVMSKFIENYEQDQASN